jgi:uncharacterized membrane protein YkgB
MNWAERKKKISNVQNEGVLKQNASGNSQDIAGNDSFNGPVPSVSLTNGTLKGISGSHSVSGNVLWINRISLFLIYFWFGFLKIVSLSPAENLVTHLHRITLSSVISINKFLVILGVAECLIGIMWLIPSLTRYTFIIFMLQMFTAFLPLILLPGDTWNNIFVLSLSGQYILKNIVLIACAFTIFKDCQPKGWKKCK